MKIKFEKINFSYDGKIDVLSNLNFSIESGKITCILGISGCGKSTIIKLLGGLVSPKNGDILYGEEDILDKSKAMIVFQDSTLLPWKTVVGNLKIAYKKEPSGLEIKKLLEKIGLSKFSDLYPNELSGGMRQRVEFGRAVAKEAELLLLDEPFNKLDTQFKKMMQDIFLRIHEEFNMTSVLITHDVDEAIRLSNHIFILSNNNKTEIKKINPKNYNKENLKKKINSILQEDFKNLNAHL